MFSKAHLVVPDAVLSVVLRGVSVAVRLRRCSRFRHERVVCRQYHVPGRVRDGWR